MSCSSKKHNDELNISVSIPPFADFTKQIVGNRATVHTLIEPGINAHFFEPSPESIKLILEADIYFRVGNIFTLENQLLDNISHEIKKEVDCSRGINLLNNDPHYWLSPNNVKIITQNILDVLIESYPQHKNYFSNNRNKFIQKIDSLDVVISDILEIKKEKTLCVYHPAWTYFANDYNLEQIGIEKDGKSPKAKDLTNIIDHAMAKGIACIFFDPHFDDNSVSTIAKSLGISIESLDPLPSDYISNLSDISKKLDEYLQ